MKKYEPRGIQAIAPSALFGLFEEIENPSNTETDDATIVTIRGPISQHGVWWESYESIRTRVVEACAKAAPAVILRIDSPGGDVDGCFDTARAIRAACDGAQKRLLVHVEGQCSSAAYALACTADRIMASRTAKVGSVGVIAARVDVTRADAQSGVEVALVTSGARKADGNPHSPLSPEELAAHQAEVDGLAAEFFELVATWRGGGGLTTEKIAALEAASFRGAAALEAGLVDELGSFDHLLASLGAETGEPMDKEEEAREALRSIAEDEDRDEASRAKARRALAALDAEEEPDAEEDEKEPEAEEDEPEDDDKEAKAAAAGTVSAATAGDLAALGAKVERRLTALERDHEAEKRQTLIAAHGGVTPELGKLLAKKPLGEVKALLAALPKPKKPKLGDAAATATVAGTRGTGTASRLAPEQAKLMDRAMGLEKPKYGVVKRGGVLLLGAPIDEGGE